MKVEVRTVGEVAIIDCAGEVDLYTSPKLRDALVAEVGPGNKSVLVNMTGVGYVDSSGIATLVEGLQLSRQAKTRFGLYGLRKNARAVLELARLDKVFAIFDNEQEALNKIASIEPFSQH